MHSKTGLRALILQGMPFFVPGILTISGTHLKKACRCSYGQTSHDATDLRLNKSSTRHADFPAVTAAATYRGKQDVLGHKMQVL